MRKALIPFQDTRRSFSATFVRKRLRITKEKSEVVILLSDIKDKHMRPICDHMWVSSNTLATMKIHPGERVSFSAKSVKYHKKDGSMDYKLCHLQEVRRIKRRELDMRKEREYL